MAELIGRDSSLREAVGVFHDAGAFEHAVQDLLTCGFDRADISMLATERTVRGKLGDYYQDTHAAEDDPQAPRQAWVGSGTRTEGRSAIAGVLGYLGAITAAGVVIASGGAAAVAIAAGVVGGGATAAVGASLGRLIERRVGETLRGQLDHGGIVLWVRLQREEQAEPAVEAMRRCGGEDIHVHQLRMAS